MKKRDPALHALVLGLLNLTGILLGFFLWQLLGGPQRNAQGLAAAAFALIGFWLWIKISMARGITLAKGNWEGLGVWILSCLIPIAIFVPLHYFTQGYMTSSGNIEVLAGLVFPTNFLAAGIMLHQSGRWTA